MTKSHSAEIINRHTRDFTLIAWFFGHFQSRTCVYGKDRIIHGDSIVFTSCFMAIFTISGAIIQTYMGGSGWFAEGTELSSIFNYYLSFVKIR